MSTNSLHVLRSEPEDKNDAPTYYLHHFRDGKRVSGYCSADNAETLGRQFGTSYHSITIAAGTDKYSWIVPSEASPNVHSLSLEERTQFKRGFDSAYLGNQRVNPLSRRAAELKSQAQ